MSPRLRSADRRLYQKLFRTDGFRNTPCPTKVIGSDPTLPYTFLPTIDLGDILTVDYDFVPETTHFLQLEKPEECAEMVREFLEINDLL